MKKPFTVIITKTVTEEIQLEANSPEEAEMLAEDLSLEGQGDVIESIVEQVEALPLDDLPVDTDTFENEGGAIE